MLRNSASLLIRASTVGKPNVRMVRSKNHHHHGILCRTMASKEDLIRYISNAENVSRKDAKELLEKYGDDILTLSPFNKQRTKEDNDDEEDDDDDDEGDE